MARALLTLAFSPTAHLTTAAKFGKKITSETRLESRWLSGPQIAQLFFALRRTIMASALLNSGFFTYRSPHHGSKICHKN